MPAIIFLAFPGHSDRWRFLSIVPQTLNCLWVFLAVLVGYLTLLAGYHFALRHSAGANHRIVFKYSEKTQFRAAVAFFLFSALTFLLYAYGHGGVFEYMLTGSEIRTGRQHAGFFQYMRYFAHGLPISMLLFFGFYKYSQFKILRKRSLYLLFFSFALSLAYAIGTAGRANIGFVLLLPFFFWLNTKRPILLSRKKIFALVFVTFFLFLLIVYGKSVIWRLPIIQEGPIAFLEAVQGHRDRYVAMEDTKIADRLVAFSRNKDHPIVSVYLAIHNPEIYQTPRLFLDWPRALVDMVPRINQPEFFVTLTPSAHNRDFLQGPEAGYVPPNWVAMTMMNGGIVWLFLGPLIAGYIGGYFNKLLLANWGSSPLLPGLFIIIAFFWEAFVGTDPFMFFLPNLRILILFLILAPMVELKIRKFYNAKKKCA